MRVVISGKSALAGRVEIGGYKHSVLPILAASIATPMVLRLSRVPAITDVDSICQALGLLGAQVERNEESLTVDTTNLRNTMIPSWLTSQFHAAYQLMPALLVRFGEFNVGLPGGCAIGDRMPRGCFAVLQSLGATLKLEDGRCLGRVTHQTGAQSIRLQTDLGLNIRNVPSATKTALIAGALGKYSLQIDESFRAPEIIDLADFLSTIGGRIEGAGTASINIQGGSQPSQAIVNYTAMPDLNEAFTYLVLSALNSGRVVVSGMMPQYLTEEFEILDRMGVEVSVEDDGFRALTPKGLTATSAMTGTYPAFGTDNHPILTALMTKADGYSRITETIWESRFAYVAGLSALVAHIWHDDSSVHVRPEKWTTGTCSIRCTDLRGGAAMAIAALERPGDTILDDFEVVLRGYSRFLGQLNELGAKLRVL